MTKTKYLSESEKALGLKMMNQEEAWNGIGYNFLADTIIYLIAVYFGASNFTLGYLASVVYIVGIVLPFVPRLLNGKNMIKVQATVWLGRSLVSFGYIGLLFLESDWAIVLLVSIYTMFCIFRIIGMVLNDFTIKNITTNTNRGAAISKVYLYYQGTSIFSRFISFVVTTLSKSLVGLVALQIVGACASIVASLKIYKIPCRSNIEYKKGRGIIAITKTYMKDKGYRSIIFIKWINVVITILLSLTIVFLRKEAKINNNLVFFYTILQAIAIVCCAFITSSIADKLGSRPLLIISTFFVLSLFAAWLLVPSNLSFIVFAIIGFLLTFFVGITNILTTKLLSSIIPNNESVGFTSMVNFGTALFAIATSILTGFLINTGSLIPKFFLCNSYIFVFGFAVLLNIVVIIIAVFYNEKGAFKTLDAASVLFSRSSLQAFSVIGRLDDKNINPVQRKALMLSLETNQSRIATNEMKNVLSSPYNKQKIDVLTALEDLPRKDLKKAIIRIALDDDNYAQIAAINALSSYRRDDEIRQTLVKLLNSRWGSTKSVVARALSFTNRSYEYLDLINHLSTQARHIEEEIDFIFAKTNMDREGNFYKEIFNKVDKRSVSFRETRYCAFASSLGASNPTLDKVYVNFINQDKDTALDLLLEENRDISELDDNYDEIKRLFSEEKYEDVVLIVQNIAKQIDNDEKRFKCIRQAILNINNASKFDYSDTIASLYFLILVLRSTSNSLEF